MTIKTNQLFFTSHTHTHTHTHTQKRGGWSERESFRWRDKRKKCRRGGLNVEKEKTGLKWRTSGAGDQ